MTVLDAISQWPVDTAAAAVVAPDEVQHTVGDTNRVYHLASVTKLLVAYAVLIAVEEGAIELDAPAGPPGSTIRHLLAHASGVAFDSDDVMAQPGEKRIYSSRGYELLADAVAEATTIPFASYVKEAVFEPLDMTSSQLTGPAGHGAQSTVEDLGSFARELLTPRLLPESTVDDATSVQFPGLAGIVPGYGHYRKCDWGLGFELHDHKQPHWMAATNSPDAYGHFGQSGTFLWVDPKFRRAVVVLTDRPFGPWAKGLWADFNSDVVDSLS